MRSHSSLTVFRNASLHWRWFKWQDEKERERNGRSRVWGEREYLSIDKGVIRRAGPICRWRRVRIYMRKVRVEPEEILPISNITLVTSPWTNLDGHVNEIDLQRKVCTLVFMTSLNPCEVTSNKNDDTEKWQYTLLIQVSHSFKPRIFDAVRTTIAPDGAATKSRCLVGRTYAFRPIWWPIFHWISSFERSRKHENWPLNVYSSVTALEIIIE
jgi:hypothetical protein